MNYVQSGTLDAWIFGVRSAGDYIDDYDSYADFYRITIPATGTITITTNASDPETGYDSDPTITIYNGMTDQIYKKWFYYAKYNSAYDWHYDSIAVSAGTYYVEIYGGSDEYHMYIEYQPTISETNIVQIKPQKKALAISWIRCSGIQGYQIQYATKKNMKNARTITIGRTARSKTIKGLKRNKKYYIRIRTYITIGGKYYYSAWSSKRVKKTK